MKLRTNSRAKGFTPYHFFYVYVLQSSKRFNELYTGCTRDLRKRLFEHNKGLTVASRRYAPWRLIYYEAFSDERSAWKRESSLKKNGNPMRELKRRIGLIPIRKSDKGFTLIEIIIVIALLGIAAAFAILVGIDSIGRATAIAERDLAVTFLETARAEALANIDESPHGLHIDGSSFVLFTGNVYDSADPSNRVYDRESAVLFTGPSDVVFDQLSGAVGVGAGTFTFSDGAQEAAVDVNEGGRIDW